MHSEWAVRWRPGLLFSKSRCLCLHRQQQTFVFLNYISHKALHVSVPSHITAFFSLSLFTIIIFLKLFFHEYIYFLHLGYHPAPPPPHPFLNWPTTDQPCGLLQPIRSRHPCGQQTVVRSKVRGHRGRGQQQQERPCRPPWCVCVCENYYTY